MGPDFFGSLAMFKVKQYSKIEADRINKSRHHDLLDVSIHCEGPFSLMFNINLEDEHNI